MNASPIKRDLLLRAKRAWWWGYTRFPGVIPEFWPPHKPSREERDAHVNEITTVPPDEMVELQCLWALEAYGPTEIDDLYAGLERLGWDRETGWSGRKGSIDWIKHQRHAGFGGNYSIGMVTRRGSEIFSPDGLVADLPRGVEYLLVKVHHVCPSLTILQIVFALDARTRALYKGALNLNRTTIFKPIRAKYASYSVLDPQSQKTDAIMTIRAELQNRVSNWIAQYLPGIFSSTVGKLLPTAECVATRRNNILGQPRETSGPGRQWCTVLTRGFQYDVWKSSDMDAVYLAPIDDEQKNRSHVLLTVCCDKVPEKTSKTYGGLESRALVALLYDRLDGVLVQFGVLALLHALRRTLMLTRDELRAARPSKRRALKALDYIQEFFGSDAQVPSIVAEIKDTTASLPDYQWLGEGFVAADVKPGQTPKQLYEYMCQYTRIMADRLIRDDEVTREGLKQMSDVIAARESVKAQRTTTRLTLLIIGLSILTVLAAVAPLPQARTWATNIRDGYNEIRGHIWGSANHSLARKPASGASPQSGGLSRAAKPVGVHGTDTQH